jgi:hypothetical protein
MQSWEVLLIAITIVGSTGDEWSSLVAVGEQGFDPLFDGIEQLTSTASQVNPLLEPRQRFLEGEISRLELLDHPFEAIENGVDPERSFPVGPFDVVVGSACLSVPRHRRANIEPCWVAAQ